MIPVADPSDRPVSLADKVAGSLAPSSSRKLLYVGRGRAPWFDRPSTVKKEEHQGALNIS